ncbi:hypothetical protein ABPG74_002452 [Tetrahymena malaccensis]
MLKNIFNKFKQIRQAHNDAKFNRKLVGTDRNGNKYYQYFDEQGYESKRECEYLNVFDQNHGNRIDPAWEDWLRKKRLDPFTQEEMEKIYRYTDNLRKKGVSADKYEQDMMKTFRRTDKYNAAEKKDFQPEQWDFDQNSKK